MLLFNFKSNIQRYAERKAKVENEIKVLKQQQKVKVETVNSEFNSRKTQFANNVSAEIAALKNQIKNLEVAKKTQAEAYEKEKSVQIEKVNNDFDAKILSKTNEVTKLTNLIDKEKKDMDEIIQPAKANAPRDNRKILNEGR